MTDSTLKDLVFKPAPSGPYRYERLGALPIVEHPPQEPDIARQQLADIADILGAWLTDNTEHAFEDEPDIDQARNLILKRIGEL